MRLQVLLSTMHRRNHDYLKTMNICSDAIVINQCDKFAYKQITHRRHDILEISMPERGVGLSRNTALMRADADIVLFADDDVRYVDGYKELVLDAFLDNPDADMIIFNVDSTNAGRRAAKITKKTQLTKFNSMRYGTYRIAVRLERIRAKNIAFTLLFGGGSVYSSGEDSIFIRDVIRSGLKGYKVSTNIGVVSHASSTWFRGYNEQYFVDRGALFFALFPRLYCLVMLRFILRKRKLYKENYSALHVYKMMLQGARQYRCYGKRGRGSV